MILQRHYNQLKEELAKMKPPNELDADAFKSAVQNGPTLLPAAAAGGANNVMGESRVIVVPHFWPTVLCQCKTESVFWTPDQCMFLGNFYSRSCDDMETFPGANSSGWKSPGGSNHVAHKPPNGPGPSALPAPPPTAIPNNAAAAAANLNMNHTDALPDDGLPTKLWVKDDIPDLADTSPSDSSSSDPLENESDNINPEILFL